MFSNSGLMAGREPASAVIVAIRNDLVRGGVERMLQALGVTRVHTRRDLGQVADTVLAGGGILVALVSEIDSTVAPDLRAAEESGTRVLLLLSGNGDVAELSRIRALGIRGAGFLTVDGLGQADLYDALSRMDNGEVPIPAELARNLLALAEQNPAAAGPAPVDTPGKRGARAHGGGPE